MSSGNYVLFYHGYDATLNKGVSLVAISPRRNGPFSGKSVAMTYDDFDTTVTASAGEAAGTVPAGVTVPTGIPLLLVGGANQEVIVAAAQDGRRVWFDRPLSHSYSGNVLYSMARRKVDISYAHENSDGSWSGIATLYGPAAGIAAEYTTGVKAPSVTGPWTFVRDGIRFKPWVSGLMNSAENPSPVISSSDCSN